MNAGGRGGGCNTERGKLRKVEESKTNGINDSFKINFFVCLFIQIPSVHFGGFPPYRLFGRKNKAKRRFKK